MRIPVYVFGILLTMLLTPSASAKTYDEADKLAQTIRRRQATRSQMVARATRPRTLKHRQAPSALPFPRSTCTDYVSTGTTPYARFSGIDYNATATYTTEVLSREACTKTCEADTGTSSQ